MAGKLKKQEEEIEPDKILKKIGRFKNLRALQRNCEHSKKTLLYTLLALQSTYYSYTETRKRHKGKRHKGSSCGQISYQCVIARLYFNCKSACVGSNFKKTMVLTPNVFLLIYNRNKASYDSRK
jgi:hypothetical protein